MEEETLEKPIWADPEFMRFIHHKITFAWCSNLKYDLADGSRGTGTKNFLVDVWERMWERQRWIVLVLASSCNILYLLLSHALGTGIYCSYSLWVQLSLATMVHKTPIGLHQDPKLPPILLCSRGPRSSAQGCLWVCHFCTSKACRLADSQHTHTSQGIPLQGHPNSWITTAPHIAVLLRFHQSLF